MTTTDHRTDEAPTQPQPAVDLKKGVLDQLGGPWGMVYAAVPIVAFVTANAVVSLPAAIGFAIAVAVGIIGWRLLRGESLGPALSGLPGVVVACGIAAWTGSANGFFLIGIWAALLGAIVTLGSLLVRRPLTGIIWNAMHGGKNPWRQDRKTLRAHDIATLAATTVFAARFGVKQWLYLTDATGWLAFAKIAMGTPLMALALLVVVWAFRHSTKRLTTQAGPAR
ncbi:DUF3159 domain-containing protein [Saccharopolyspora shandongensis]|uniref:DUF3159 domain-containing protein n=1 Tax=Saccharopolyspora shandongensis TaxID=418495 RepID=UPI0034465C00